MALPNDPGFDWAPVADLPYVRALEQFAVTGFDVVGHPDANVDFPRAAAPVGEPMELQVALAGRVPDPARFDEVAISEGFHDRSGIGIGDELVLQIPGPGVVSAMLAGRPPPDVPGPEVHAHVVGIAKGSFWNGDVQSTLALYERFQDDLTPPGVGYVNAMLLLDGGAATLPRLQADLERLAGRPIEAVDFSRYVQQAASGTDVESTALLTFALVAALVTIVLGGIAVVRTTAGTGSDLETLRAIGFTRVQAITASAARPVMAVLAGAAGAVLVAYLLSGRYPIGVGRYLEPSPGRHANVALLAVGATALAVIGVGGAIVRGVAPRTTPRRCGLDRPRPPRRLPLDAPPVPLPAAMGWRLAVERRPGVGGRSATVALTFGVTAVVAALTFGAGLDRGATDGMLSGQPFDSYTVRVGAADLPVDVVAAWRADDRIAAMSRFVDTVSTIDGRAVAVFAISDVKGHFEDHPLRGRVPTADDEISFAPTEMNAPRTRCRRHGDARRSADARRRGGVHAAGRTHQLRRGGPGDTGRPGGARPRRRPDQVRLAGVAGRARRRRRRAARSVARHRGRHRWPGRRCNATSIRPGCCRACCPDSWCCSPSVPPATRWRARRAGADVRWRSSRCSG